MATGHSQKCCETLVGAGAISTLLKLIRSVSRSIPDQEVLKHALSTLRNLSRYPHLIEVLIDTHGSIEILLWELLRFVKIILEHHDKTNLFLLIITKCYLSITCIQE